MKKHYIITAREFDPENWIILNKSTLPEDLFTSIGFEKYEVVFRFDDYPPTCWYESSLYYREEFNLMKDAICRNIAFDRIMFAYRVKEDYIKSKVDGATQEAFEEWKTLMDKEIIETTLKICYQQEKAKYNKEIYDEEMIELALQIGVNLEEGHEWKECSKYSFGVYPPYTNDVVEYKAKIIYDTAEGSYKGFTRKIFLERFKALRTEEKGSQITSYVVNQNGEIVLIRTKNINTDNEYSNSYLEQVLVRQSIEFNNEGEECNIYLPFFIYNKSNKIRLAKSHCGVLNKKLGEIQETFSKHGYTSQNSYTCIPYIPYTPHVSMREASQKENKKSNKKQSEKEITRQEKLAILTTPHTVVKKNGNKYRWESSANFKVDCVSKKYIYASIDPTTGKIIGEVKNFIKEEIE